MQVHDPAIALRKNETDFAPDKLDTEKLVQVITAITPSSVALPSAEQRKVKDVERSFQICDSTATWQLAVGDSEELSMGHLV